MTVIFRGIIVVENEVGAACWQGWWCIWSVGESMKWSGEVVDNGNGSGMEIIAVISICRVSGGVAQDYQSLNGSVSSKVGAVAGCKAINYWVGRSYGAHPRHSQHPSRHPHLTHFFTPASISYVFLIISMSIHRSPSSHSITG
ncbi:hypothetical protein Tco_1548973 [Tanacetum coccineum]